MLFRSYARTLTRRLAGVDLSTTAIELALRPLGDHLSCETCRTTLYERVKQLMVQWSLVKVCCIPLAYMLIIFNFATADDMMGNARAYTRLR